MFHFIFEQIYINERENGEHQCRKSRFLVKNSKRYATGQSAIFHSTQKKKRSNFIFWNVKKAAYFPDGKGEEKRTGESDYSDKKEFKRPLYN